VIIEVRAVIYVGMFWRARTERGVLDADVADLADVSILLYASLRATTATMHRWTSIASKERKENAMALTYKEIRASLAETWMDVIADLPSLPSHYHTQFPIFIAECLARAGKTMLD
jgi:hypothetical protein